MKLYKEVDMVKLSKKLKYAVGAGLAVTTAVGFIA